MSAAFDELLDEQKPSGLMVQLGDYPEVFQTAYADRMVRRPESADAQLQIYGQLEARLTQSDRVDSRRAGRRRWPPAPRVDPWLSRPMRHELGLDLPERRIGLSAHDFAQTARRTGSDPQPCGESRRRAGGGLALPASAGSGRRREALEGSDRAGERYVALAARARPARRVKPIAQPAPKPPREARPAALSVTEIEDWLRDPYTIYARTS